MSDAIVVTGTDTDVGKTIFAAALAAALGGSYWKPIQAGLAGETDTDVVRRLARLTEARIVPEAYRLTMAASPHLAAEAEGIEVDLERLALPASIRVRPLIVEGAGGILVPLNRRHLQIELFARWRAPVMLIASTRLGTINHSLLSIEALRARGVPLLGIAFVGAENSEVERTIADIGGVRRIGRLPHLDPLDADTLRAAFAAHFRAGELLAPVMT